jgi:hypothetical protein
MWSERNRDLLQRVRYASAEYRVLFGDRVLDTLSSDDIFLPAEQIMATIEAYPR